METFFKVKTPAEVFEILDRFNPVGEETVDLDEAFNRVLSRDMFSPEDLPEFFRSAMDGYAVRAKSTFGASETLPALLEVRGEAPMGRKPGIHVSEGQAVKISTGGMLPQGADGVVMVEYCHLLDEKTLEVTRAISPLENVIRPGDDFKKGDAILSKGYRLRPQDLGILAGLGQVRVPVYKRPTVAIISTGDEIVPVDVAPTPGQVRDINRFTLAAFSRKSGAEPLFLGLCPDDFHHLKEQVDRGLELADTVWLSGGSSVGTRDLTLTVLEALDEFQLFVHGISISPGKPTIIGVSRSKPIIGLPGHVASALVVADIFLSRLLTILSGQKDTVSGLAYRVNAKLARNIESVGGREDYIRVKLTTSADDLIAEPIFGKSGLISPLVEADGLIQIDMNTEGLYRGQKVTVQLFDPRRGGIRWTGKSICQ